MLNNFQEWLKDNTDLMDVEIAHILDQLSAYPVTTSDPHLLAEKLQAVAGIRDWEIVSRQDYLNPKYLEFEQEVTLSLLEFAECKIQGTQPATNEEIKMLQDAGLDLSMFVV